MLSFLTTTFLVSLARVADSARAQQRLSVGQELVMDYLAAQGQSDEMSQKIAAGLTEALGDVSDMDVDDIRKAASQLLQHHAREELLEANNFTFDHAAYHAERATVELTGSLLEKSSDEFVGPIPGVDCKDYKHIDTAHVGLVNCKHMCSTHPECKAFSHSVTRAGKHICETFSKCIVGKGNFALYVRNTEGVTTEHIPPRPYTGSHFYVIGDWGSESCFPQPRASMHYLKNGPEFESPKWMVDDQAQKKIAGVMGFTGRMLKPFLVVNAGDNFYWGGVWHPTRGGGGVHDAMWDDAFEAVYKHKAISRVPWLSIMGNHDYGGNGCWADPAVQFDYMWKDHLANGRWQMPGPFYNHRAEVVYNHQGVVDGVSIEYFMLDTNIEDHMSGRSGGICEQKLCPKRKTPLPITQADCIKFFQTLWSRQTAWLGKAMQASTADWKIVVQHHKPTGSVGKNIYDIIQPGGAHLVIGSHTHEMSFYEKTDPPMLVVGGGGGAQANPGCADGTFCSAKYGFGSVAVSREKLTVKIIHFDGKMGYEGSICRSRKMC